MSVLGVPSVLGAEGAVITSDAQSAKALAGARAALIVKAVTLGTVALRPGMA